MIRRIYNVCSCREVSAKKNEEKNKEEMLHHMEEQALEDYKVYQEKNILKVKLIE